MFFAQDSLGYCILAGSLSDRWILSVFAPGLSGPEADEKG